jgi:hypothetical protein
MGIISRGVGLAALGMVLYDAHYLGKVKSDLYASEKDAASTGYYLNNSMYLDKMSKVQERIRTASFTTELDQNWKRFINEPIGYFKGFFSMLVNHAVPFTLGLGALLAPKGISKFCAGGLGLYGAYQFVKNFFGWGTPPGLDKMT